jgi:mono/diheme cytochrome c family protein
MVVRTIVSPLRFCMMAGWIVGLCSGREKPVPKVPDASSALLSGAELYKRHCVACHGEDLKGNGPFPSPYRMPPDLSTLSRRHGGRFPEAYREVIS